MRRALWLVPLLVSLAGMGPVPVFLPTRDVRVEYRVVASVPHPREVEVSYDRALGRARIEASGEPAYALVDRDRSQITLVVDFLRATTSVHFDAEHGWQFLLGRQAAFTRLGPDRVAGFACRDWEVRTKEGDATACLTPDGVLLRGAFTGSRRGTGSIEATSVDYEHVPRSMFEVPAGYRTLPSLPPGVLGLNFPPDAASSRRAPSDNGQTEQRNLP